MSTHGTQKAYSPFVAFLPPKLLYFMLRILDLPSEFIISMQLCSALSGVLELPDLTQEMSNHNVHLFNFFNQKSNLFVRLQIFCFVF